MLKKLLKYDLKNIARFMLIFYALAIIFAIFTRLCELGADSSTFVFILARITSVTTIILIINIFINALLRTWARFRATIYGPEAYLTHTLPIKKSTLLAEKFLLALITVIVSTIVIIITLAIAFLTPDIWQSLTDALNTAFSGSLAPLILTLVLLVLELIFASFVGLFGIVIGHKQTNHKIPFSVLFALVAYFVAQTIFVIILALLSLTSPDLAAIFTEKTTISTSLLTTLLSTGVAVYAALSLLVPLITYQNFKKGINVD